ncbi:MAG: TonB-dependent receptor [Gammaproteobacteria bacterium]|nr:TonB-dependent receptor [Gammaproteobacteria bacterium]
MGLTTIGRRGWLVVAAVIGAAAPVYAGVLEEVVVTAQRREQSLQDVGISVTAFSGEQLKALGMSTSMDIAAQTPGLNIGVPTGEGNNPVIALRGVALNDFNDALEGPVAVYVDEAYKSMLAGLTFQLFDVERVEVLRGPQGTLFGRNTTGGLLHFISRKPTREPEAYGDLTFGSYDQVKFEGAVSGPLSERLAGRFAFARNGHDGWMSNRVPPSDGDVINEADDWAGRAQLLFDASEDLSVLVNVHGTRSNTTGSAYGHRASFIDVDGTSRFVPDDVDVYGTCPGCDLLGYRDTDGDIYTVDADRLLGLEVETLGTTGTVTWQVGAVTVTSITDYLQIDRHYREDPDVGPLPLVATDYAVDGDQFSEELRVAGELERLRWTAGFYYFSRSLDGKQLADASQVIPLSIQDVNWTYDTDSWALFGQLEYDIAPQWTVIGGLRFTSEQQDFEELIVEGLAPFNLAFGPLDFTRAAVGSQTEQDSDNWSARIELDWRPNDDWLVYVSSNRGVKSGGFNTGFLGGTPVNLIPFDEEILTSVEVGFKSTLFNGTSNLNVAAFYYDYQDLQAFQFVGLSQLLFNTDAEVKGVDAELITRPTDRWEFRFGLSYLDARAFDIVNAVGAVRDRDMILAPEITFTGLGRYSWGIFGGTATLQADFNYKSRHYFEIQNHDNTRESGYVLGNARLAWSPAGERWALAVFVQNLADQEYRAYAFDLSALGVTQEMYGRPRWVGGTLSVRWE